MAIEVVDLPIQNGESFYKLWNTFPEGRFKTLASPQLYFTNTSHTALWHQRHHRRGALIDGAHQGYARPIPRDQPKASPGCVQRDVCDRCDVAGDLRQETLGEMMVGIGWNSLDGFSMGFSFPMVFHRLPSPRQKTLKKVSQMFWQCFCTSEWVGDSQWFTPRFFHAMVAQWLCYSTN